MMKLNLKNFFIFFSTFLIIVLLERKFLGSPGFASLKSYNPLTWIEILQNMHRYLLGDFLLSIIVFFTLYKINKYEKNKNNTHNNDDK